MDWKVTRQIVDSSGISEIDDAVRQQITADMARRIEQDLVSSFTTGTATAELPTLDGKKFLDDCERFAREARRNQFVVIVDMALRYDAQLLMEQTPCDGQRIEMSHRQAQELHRHWPLKLHKVLSPERAEFVPASALFNEFVPAILPAPPYAMTDETEST